MKNTAINMLLLFPVQGIIYPVPPVGSYVMVTESGDYMLVESSTSIMITET